MSCKPFNLVIIGLFHHTFRIHDWLFSPLKWGKSPISFLLKLISVELFIEFKRVCDWMGKGRHSFTPLPCSQARLPPP